MQKIPTLFERDETVKGHPVTGVLKPGCLWVAAGQGIATKKLDGTNVKIEGGRLFKRQKPKDGDYDDAAYVETSRDSPADRYLYEAFDALPVKEDGIYEAIGVKIQGNPEGVDGHKLVRVVPPDRSLELADVPRDFDGLREYLASHDMEGIVFHGPGGRFAKIKAKDFGLKRKS